MKIGIIIHSKTGNTYSTAINIKEKLEDNGHKVNIDKLIPIDKVHPGVKNIKLKNNPDVGGYDALVFGAPVWAFSVSPVMSEYLTNLSSLKNKNIFCYVTKALSFNFTGGTQAVSKMMKICKSKGGNVIGTDIIFVGRKPEKSNELKLLNKIQDLFK